MDVKGPSWDQKSHYFPIHWKESIQKIPESHLFWFLSHIFTAEILFKKM